MADHEVFIRRCLELAENGLGKVCPNPMVGCVIVHDGQIIGEGFHRQFGEAHAEVNAVNSVLDHELLKSSTIYVSLEPCSHFGKTPPCVDLIVKHKIPRAVIANKDPFPAVSGRGISRLREAGVEVVTGVLEDEGKHLNRRFFTFHEKKRPYIILKWAQTADGFMDIDRSIVRDPSYWISSKLSKTLVHLWRVQEDSILVGTNTAKNDNPSLTVRSVAGENPVRILLDRNLTIDKSTAIFSKNAKTIVLNEQLDSVEDHIRYVMLDFEQSIFPQLFDFLYKEKIQTLIVEGGKNILEQLIAQDFWDEARIFHASHSFGKGLKAPEIAGREIGNERIETDQLITLKNSSQE